MSIKNEDIKKAVDLSPEDLSKVSGGLSEGLRFDDDLFYNSTVGSGEDYYLPEAQDDGSMKPKIQDIAEPALPPDDGFSLP